MRIPPLFLAVGVVSLAFVGGCDEGDDDGVAGEVSPTATESLDDDTAVDPGAETGAYDKFSDLNGEWSGDWTNDSSGSTAPLTIVMSINEDGTASFTLDLPSSDLGAPFGLPQVDVRTVDGTYDDSGLTVETQDDELFGSLSVTISPDGRFSAEATMDPVDAIDSLTVEGTIAGTDMDATYTVSFPDGADATGTATLTTP